MRWPSLSIREALLAPNTARDRLAPVPDYRAGSTVICASHTTIHSVHDKQGPIESVRVGLQAQSTPQRMRSGPCGVPG